MRKVKRRRKRSIEGGEELRTDMVGLSGHKNYLSSVKSIPHTLVVSNSAAG